VAIERQQGATSLIDVLDRVLDKGLVIDAWVPLSDVGIGVITVEGRVVVASTDTYSKELGVSVRQAPTPQPFRSIEDTVHRPPGDDDGGRGGNTPPTGGAPSFAGFADITPRKAPSRHRRPID
jgi:gas vesicle structural protein